MTKPNQSIAKVADKKTLETLLQGSVFQESLQTVLPKHLTPERVVKMALVAASRQPRLWECTQESILQSIMKSAELGLDCSGTLGRAYLVPYWNSKISKYEAQFIPGYQGLIELARRSGSIARIESRVVYENDYFEVEFGLDQKLIHRPSFNDPGPMKCVYAVAEMVDGSRQIEVMTIEDVEGIKARSKSRDRQGNLTGPWVTDESEMARKTVIRRIAKYLPLSTELAKAFEADDESFLRHADSVDMAENTRARANALRDQIAPAPAEDEAVEEEPQDEPEEEAAPEVPAEPENEQDEAQDEEEPATELTYEEAKAIVDEKSKALDPKALKALLGGRKVTSMDRKALIAFIGELDKAAS